MRYSLGRFTFRDVPQIAAYHNKFIFQEKVADTTLGKKNADGLYNPNFLSEWCRCGADMKKLKVFDVFVFNRRNQIICC